MKLQKKLDWIAERVKADGWDDLDRLNGFQAVRGALDALSLQDSDLASFLAGVMERAEEFRLGVVGVRRATTDPVRKAGRDAFEAFERGDVG